MPREVKWAISFLVGAGLLWIGWKVFIFLIVLHVILCFILMGVILLQSGEAADLAGAFGGSGSQTAFGPRGAATFLSRATTWCAVMFMFTTMALTVHVDTTTRAGGRSVLEQFYKTSPSSPRPAAPAQPALPAIPATPPAQPSPPAPSAPAQQPAAPATPSAPQGK